MGPSGGKSADAVAKIKKQFRIPNSLPRIPAPETDRTQRPISPAAGAHGRKRMRPTETRPANGPRSHSLAARTAPAANRYSRRSGRGRETHDKPPYERCTSSDCRVCPVASKPHPNRRLRRQLRRGSRSAMGIRRSGTHKIAGHSSK